MLRLTRIPADSILGAALRAPLRFIPRHHVTTVRSGINRGAKWVVGSTSHDCWLGTYENEMQMVVNRRVRPGMVVWDVGANVGFYTLAFSRLVGPAGRVFAIEPSARNVGHLLEHVRRNRADNVHVVQAALADRTGVSGFLVEPSGAMDHLFTRATSYSVPTFAADDLLAHLPDARPDLLKVDIEGAESAFLLGAAGLLREWAPELLLAVHGQAEAIACDRLLRAHGYSLFELDGSDAPPTPRERGELHAWRLAPSRRAAAGDRPGVAVGRTIVDEREPVGFSRGG